MAGLGLMKQPDDPLDIYILDLFNIRQLKSHAAPGFKQCMRIGHFPRQSQAEQLIKQCVMKIRQFPATLEQGFSIHIVIFHGY